MTAFDQDLYRVDDLQRGAADGPIAAVVGWPVAHARSPLIQGYWLRKLGRAGGYGRIAVRPEDAARFFAGLARSGLAGANVTVPHKEAAFAACDEFEPVARATGAVNTLWIEAGKLCGTNTDALGFLANLDDRAHGWDNSGGQALVLGAGGAARAVVWALASRGLKVRIVNRTRARAEELATRLGAVAHDWSEAEALLGQTRVLVNTTSLGMSGKGDLDLDLAALPATALVTDIVYVPLETPLLARARARGNPTVDGLGMLLHQAVPGFRRWFGGCPEVTPALRDLVLADIEGHR
ncbi:shikimate dehydrogenase [Methyloraptor flagellatus]|uniref:Shikimate dehydrogenase (NADP(+)) n=1 Tax=Methyloraptor flagellatus TaxID=3162530 RepID=A0AAU7XAT4_9HYPH